MKRDGKANDVSEIACSLRSLSLSSCDYSCPPLSFCSLRVKGRVWGRERGRPITAHSHHSLASVVSLLVPSVFLVLQPHTFGLITRLTERSGVWGGRCLGSHSVPTVRSTPTRRCATRTVRGEARSGLQTRPTSDTE